MNMVFIVVALLSGVLFTLVGQRIFKDFKRSFFNKASVIRKYWIFVLIFVVTGGIAYYYVFFLLKGEDFNRYSILLGQICPLIFGIFVGYYAFLQVMENRTEKYAERGLDRIRKSQFNRAKKDLEDCYRFDPSDFDNLSNLLELYLIIQDYGSFSNKIVELDKIIMEDDEKIITHYLKAAESLLRQDIGTAKERIINLVDFTKGNRELLEKFSWSFNEIKDSNNYKKLGKQSEALMIFENLIKYLSKGLNEEEKTKFESHTFSW